MENLLKAAPIDNRRINTLNLIFIIILTLTNVLAEIFLLRQNSNLFLWLFILPAVTGALGGWIAGKIKGGSYLRFKVILIFVFILFDGMIFLELRDILELFLFICFFAALNFLVLFGLVKKAVHWLLVLALALVSTLVFTLIPLYLMFTLLGG